MKKQGDIASLFRNHAAKRQKFIVSTPQEQEEERINEEIVNPMPSAPSPPTLYDVSRLPHDPGERQPITSYHANDHDAIRRAYILRGPFQPYAHEFPNRKIGDRDQPIKILLWHTLCKNHRSATALACPSSLLLSVRTRSGNVQGRIRAETMQSLVKNCQKKKNRGGKRRPIAVPVDLGVHGRNPARERTLRACVGHGARRLLWPPPLATAVLVMGTLIIGLATMHLD
jgi:hypothetical protein